ISIELNSTVATRARFNAPYRCVTVLEGDSRVVLPKVLMDREANNDARPFIVWLDHDSHLDEDRLAELEYLVEHLTANSYLLVTAPVQAGAFGGAANAVSTAIEIYGASFPEENWANSRAVKRSREADFSRDVGVAISTR